MNVSKQVSNKQEFMVAKEALKDSDVSKTEEKGTVHTWWALFSVSFTFILSTQQNCSVRRSLF